MKQMPGLHPDTLAAPHPFHRGFKPLIALWIRNYKTRKSLKGMESHRLHDIGLNRTQAEAEGRKSFWR